MTIEDDILNKKGNFMNIFETLLINIIFIISPFLIYLFYLAYNKNISKKANQIFLEIAIFSSLYLVLKYNINSNPILLISIPLLIAFWYKRNISIFLISFVLIIYYNYYFDFSLVYLIIEYIFYIVIYFVFRNKINIFIYLFVILKSLFFIIYMFNTFNYLNIIESIILFSISSFLIIYLINKGEDIIRYHMNVKQLEENEQIKTSLFKITHEIKNPIAVCKGYLDMYDKNNIEHQKYIPIIKEEIERTLVLLQDFLSISKIKLNKDILDINFLIENVVANFKTLAKENNIKLILDLIDDEVFIEGDYNRLEQVMINILKNSIEAINEKGTIKISLKELSNSINIVVEDDGIGIEDTKIITEPFYTTKKSGTGLGVPLSKEIITSHQGKLIYQSKIGKGTIVSIELPKQIKY